MPLANLKDMTLEEIEKLVAKHGKEKYRARQILKWVYQQGAVSFKEMTNLSKDFRKQMEDIARISALEIAATQTSSDGTIKILFRLEDGLHIEGVLIPGRSHWTQCVSTQAGCRMGCTFCLTGLSGFKRDLLPSEIVDQVTRVRFAMEEGKKVGNIVLMGMGEPLVNYENTLKAIRIMTCDDGLAFSTRRITLSTCGIPPMILKLGEDACVNLAVSLNAPDDRTRNTLMPINRKYPLETLIKSCRDYPMPRRRRITFEYILIDGVNASPEDAKKLVRLFRGMKCKFNLIPFNEFPGTPYRAPSRKTIEAFQKVLVDHHYTAVIRKSCGKDILAACGQLSGRAQL
jgi:23S rRNA (adenine2503-C2)-methyltransferase